MEFCGKEESKLLYKWNSLRFPPPAPELMEEDGQAEFSIGSLHDQSLRAGHSGKVAS